MALWNEALNTFSALWLETMLRVCLQGALALGLVWGLCRLFPRLPSAGRCWLWRLALLKLLIVFLCLPTLDLPLLPAADPPSSASMTTPTPGAVGPIAVAAASPAETEPVAAVSLPASPASAVPTTAGWLLLLWLGVMAWQGSRAIRQGIAVRQLRRSGRPLDGGQLDFWNVALCRDLHLSGVPHLLASSAIATPVLIGSFRPCILLPEALLSTCTPDELRLILAHELAHVRRRDLLWGWLSLLARLVCGFHPLVRLAERELSMAQEIACDELALHLTGAASAAYGSLLVRVAAGFAPASPRGFGMIGMTESYHTLKRRLSAMKSFPSAPRHYRVVVRFTLLTLSLAALAPWRVAAQTPVPAPPTPAPPVTPSPSTTPPTSAPAVPATPAAPATPAPRATPSHTAPQAPAAPRATPSVPAPAAPPRPEVVPVPAAPGTQDTPPSAAPEVPLTPTAPVSIGAPQAGGTTPALAPTAPAGIGAPQGGGVATPASEAATQAAPARTTSRRASRISRTSASAAERPVAVTITGQGTSISAPAAVSISPRGSVTTRSFRGGSDARSFAEDDGAAISADDGYPIAAPGQIASPPSARAAERPLTTTTTGRTLRGRAASRAVRSQEPGATTVRPARRGRSGAAADPLAPIDPSATPAPDPFVAPRGRRSRGANDPLAPSSRTVDPTVRPATPSSLPGLGAPAAAPSDPTALPGAAPRTAPIVPANPTQPIGAPRATPLDTNTLPPSPKASAPQGALTPAERRIPILSELPYLGQLFRFTPSQSTKEAGPAAHRVPILSDLPILGALFQ